jgi:hypothetical protein
VSGFDKVRKIHDDRIRKVTTQEVLRLKELLSRR